ncbi:MAG: flagellar FliJ family protein [Armatimonadota bacterium]|nr:MAG: flagellar FliJ family protein [Armatimonadota bacterium]
MRAFRYRLSAALKRAQHIEHLLQIDLARLQRHLADALRRLHRLHRLRNQIHARLRVLQAATPPGGSPPAGPANEVNLERVALLHRQLEQLDEALTSAAHMRRELERRVSAARDHLLEAARSRRVFESHRDNLARSHHRAELAAETKHLDELGAQHQGAQHQGARRQTAGLSGAERPAAEQENRREGGP